MKILVPTDFSLFADLALETAIQLAKKWNGEIHLYHSANLPEDWEDLPSEVRYKDKINKPYALLVRDKLERLCAQAKSEGVPCFDHYTGGAFLNNITEITSKIKFDLIVMGSHGVSGKEEWFIGSNTQKVIRKLHHNVLVVKNPIKTIDFKEVLFVTGLDKVDQEAFGYFLEFISKFDIKKVHIMSVDTSSFFTQPAFLMKEVLKDFEKIAKDFPVETHFYRDYSIDAGIRHFSEANNIDLIAISNCKRHPFQRIFRGSNVEMLVNHSEIPVLTIDNLDVNKQAANTSEQLNVSQKG